MTGKKSLVASQVGLRVGESHPILGQKMCLGQNLYIRKQKTMIEDKEKT